MLVFAFCAKVIFIAHRVKSSFVIAAFTSVNFTGLDASFLRNLLLLSTAMGWLVSSTAVSWRIHSKNRFEFICFYLLFYSVGHEFSFKTTMWHEIVTDFFQWANRQSSRPNTLKTSVRIFQPMSNTKGNRLTVQCGDYRKNFNTSRRLH